MNKDRTRNLLMEELISSDNLTEQSESNKNMKKFTPKMRDDLIAVFRKHNIEVDDPNVSLVISQFFDNLSRV